MQYGVSRSLAKCLQVNGVDSVFLVTGGDQPFWISLREAGINLYLARSEASAVYMADAYTRVSGRPSVVYGQWGPGAANVAAALADAWWSRSPVVALTSAMTTRTSHRYEYQEIEQLRMFDSVTKWNKAVPRSDRAAEMLASAIRVATSGAPRPVHLDVARDFLEADDELREGYQVPHRFRPTADRVALREAIRILAAADRPVVLAGNGVNLANGEEELLGFAEHANVPVLTSTGGKGSIAEDHPLAVGVTGRYSRRVANEIMAEADYVLVVGSDLGGMVTTGYQFPRADVHVVQIDIDADVLGANLNVDLPIQGDARDALAVLAELSLELGDKRWTGWVQKVQARVHEWKRRFHTIATSDRGDRDLLPEAVVHILSKHLASDDTLSVDTGYMGAWGGALYPTTRPGRRFIRAAGSLGWAFPAAIGVQLARPRSRSVCLTGDGGLGYHIGDMETAMRLGASSVTVVLNNNSLAFEYHMQKYHYQNEIVPEVNDFSNINYADVAKAFGAYGARVTTNDALEDALAEALRADRPALIDVAVSKERYAPVTSYEKLMDRDL